MANLIEFNYLCKLVVLSSTKMAYFSGTVSLIMMGFSPKYSSKYEACIALENCIFIFIVKIRIDQVTYKQTLLIIGPFFTLILYLSAISSNIGTMSSLGCPCSSALPGGYHDNTSTPGDKRYDNNEKK